MWGATIVEPFFVGSFWHEFEGDNKATLLSGASITLKDELDDSWGELGGVNLFTGPPLPSSSRATPWSAAISRALTSRAAAAWAGNAANATRRFATMHLRHGADLSVS
jgi:hypothetical protein